ncbi:MAG: hypothetical protein Q8S17_03355, partial [Humidesulfovibrio sp.]|nr:hypothetical protein [Humidesulfovibrio sp.]
LNTNDTDLRSIRSQGPMVARSLNFQTQGNSVMEMLSSSPQPVVKSFEDPMDGASNITMSPRFNATEPLLNHIPTAMNSVDPKVEAIRSLFNANA